MGIGWSAYESKTYAALAIQGSSTASQIAKKAGVPTNRVYQILENLIEKGFVERISAIGLTTIYKVKDITDILKKELEEKKNKYQNVLDNIIQLKERQNMDPLRTFTIYGRKELNNQLRKLIKGAKKEIYFFVDTLVEIKNGELVDTLNEKVEDLDIELKLLTIPRGINDKYEKEVYKELIDVELRITDDTFSTIVLIVDEKELVFVSYTQLSEESTPRDYFGVYLLDQNTVKMFLRIFNLAWETAISPPEK